MSRNLSSPANLIRIKARHAVQTWLISIALIASLYLAVMCGSILFAVLSAILSLLLFVSAAQIETTISKRLTISKNVRFYLNIVFAIGGVGFLFWFTPNLILSVKYAIDAWQIHHQPIPNVYFTSDAFLFTFNVLAAILVGSPAFWFTSEKRARIGVSLTLLPSMIWWSLACLNVAGLTTNYVRFSTAAWQVLAVVAFPIVVKGWGYPELLYRIVQRGRSGNLAADLDRCASIAVRILVYGTLALMVVPPDYLPFYREDVDELLLLAGLSLIFIGLLWMSVAAFAESVLWGCAVMFSLGFLGAGFAMAHVKQGLRPFVVWGMGIVYLIASLEGFSPAP